MENLPSNDSNILDIKVLQKKDSDLKLRDIHYLDNKKSELLIDSITNLKHKTIILIMMDCGLRVSECITLQVRNFDFRNKTIIVKSLKKRGEDSVRQIPISSRLLEVLAQYLKERNPKNPDDYIFPGINGRAHIDRKAVNRFLDRFKAKNPHFENLHPHALRHTFATQLLATGTELHNVKELLGHTSINTTLIYNHTPLEILRKNIDNATAKNLTFWQRIVSRFKKPKEVFFNYSLQSQNYTVGRGAELKQLIDNANKKINTILIGGIGTGKSHLLNQIDCDKILKIDELANLKVTFVNLLVYLYDNDKEAIKQLVFGDFDKSKMVQKLQRDSVASLIEEIIKITQKHEYIIVIDNVDNITAKASKVIEQLKDHFVIITSAREVPISKSSFLWNFERINIENLNRTYALELIHRLSYDVEVENMELYRNYIYDQSEGNPRIIFELCDRYRKEIIVTDDIIRSVRHLGGLPEIDMTFIVVLILAGLTILRYTSREVGGTSLRFIGGISLVSLMLIRMFLGKMKRKFF